MSAVVTMRTLTAHHRFGLAAVATAITLLAGLPVAANGDTTVDDDDTTIPAPPLIDHDDNTPWTLPTRPERCTPAQIDLGDVRACLLDTWARPAERGWGTPPEPHRDDEAWTWTGSNYNGSPALAEWETNMVGNAERISRLRADRIEIHADAAALFHGFLDEVAHHGYEVRDGIGYSFRCTAGTGGWDCPNGAGGLSFHAWGLAIDINAGANPIVTYRDADGGSACSVEMVTDMPEWVIRTAEKWGLYWGGYGWSGDCRSPDDDRSSTFRDPPHFEFRGSPELAARIVDFNLRNDPTIGCYDVVADDGSMSLRCNRAFEVEAGWRVAVDTGAPPEAIAAVVNLTATDTNDIGFLTVDDCAPRAPGIPETSNVNHGDGTDAANLAIAPLDPSGRICVHHSSSAHGIVDVLGFILPETIDGTLALTPLPPRRVEDTRRASALTAKTPHTSNLGTQHPVLANLTTVAMSAPGYASTGRCDLLDGIPSWSNVNYTAEAARANLALLRPAENGDVCTYSYSSTDVLIDVLAELTPDGLQWTPTTPRRVLDSRQCSSNRCGSPLPGGELHRIPIIETSSSDDQASAAMVNVTLTGAVDDTFVTLADCSTFTTTPSGKVEHPATSTANVDAGSTVANLTLTGVTDGEACLWARDDTHVIIDVQSVLSPDGGFAVLPINPTRVYDGRKGG